MALPKLTTPTYELEIPSTDEKISYRPFLVKEEKILLMAMESGKNEYIINAVKQIVSECTFNKLKVGTMPMFDIEYIFLNIRAKSIGEDIKMTITCPDDKTTQVPVTVYVDEIKVIKPKDHKIDIVLDDKMTLRMKYPSLNQFVNNNFTVDDNPESIVDKTFQVVADCMDTVYTGEDAWDASDYSPSERMDFVNQLSSKQYKQVEKFFDTMPKLSHTIEVVNPNTKQKSSIVLEGLADFFG